MNAAIGSGILRTCTGLLLLAALAACNEKDAKSESAPDRLAQAQAATEAALRAGLASYGQPQIRAVQGYAQAMPNTVAVCGQVNAKGASGAFVPFVTVVTYSEGAEPVLEQHIALSDVEATRVYVETVSRCREEGGPKPTLRQAAPPLLPPIPTNLPQVTQVTTTVVVPQGAKDQVQQAAPGAAAQSASGTLSMRQPGNLREHPNGGGQVLRVVPAGTSLTIFGTAPGGWYQVGASSPEGWVHGSLVTLRR
ncbi:SH3 domain-containing protein [Roseomonas gilardii subsp. gilardii]|uniref:SH3 domain-containing protein n=1 Tax=Roseomonas gilardii TaxID=257708 RepID=UPI001FFA4E5A|nr:SH3 domain-containing protein [Roseomonas gilardii]UPG73328.1 SH3 domain-containing protein [Roseomonas gilardii subsp. gilardii]